MTTPAKMRFVFALGVISWGSIASAERPNVVLFLVDDMGWMDSTPYGSQYYETPNLKRLERHSMRFLPPAARIRGNPPSRGALAVFLDRVLLHHRDFVYAPRRLGSTRLLGACPSAARRRPANVCPVTTSRTSVSQKPPIPESDSGKNTHNSSGRSGGRPKPAVRVATSSQTASAR